MTEQTTPSTWQVTGQTQRIKANAANGVEEGYDVTFTTGQGHTGSVFVPMARYTPDNVRVLIAAQAQLLDSVGALSSGG